MQAGCRQGPMKSLLLVSNGLISAMGGPHTHPALSPWQTELTSYRRKWFLCPDRNPLAWYAAISGMSPSALLASACSILPDETRQCWVASPYHAQLGRDRVRLLEEGTLAWTAEDAAWISDLLNPLLQEDQMRLYPLGAALLLACRQPMLAEPVPFAGISGRHLPNRLPDGPDAGRFTRLLSEIQMLLHQHQAGHRRERGEPDINGLWLWGASACPVSSGGAAFPVATRNPFLQSLVDGRDARIIITEAERLSELILKDGRLPRRVVLAGEGHAALLRQSFIPWPGKPDWQPESPAVEDELLAWLRDSV